MPWRAPSTGAAPWREPSPPAKHWMSASISARRCRSIISTDGRLRSTGKSTASRLTSNRPRSHPRPALGQGRDCVGLFGEDRIRIPKPPWRALDREKTGMTAFDPFRPYTQNRPLTPIATVISSSVRLTYLVASLNGRPIRSGRKPWGGSHQQDRPAARKDG